jgi:hypothetical protein
LHAFEPLQLLFALWHKLWPLHALPPTHLTCDAAALESELSAAYAALLAKISATAVASIAPVSLPLVIVAISLTI